MLTCNASAPSHNQLCLLLKGCDDKLKLDHPKLAMTELIMPMPPRAKQCQWGRTLDRYLCKLQPLAGPLILQG